MNIKTGRYASVGLVTASSGARFGVRDGVSLPDADAGTELEACYRADPSRVERRAADYRKISRKAALSILLALLLVCAAVYTGHVRAYNKAVESLEDMVASMEKTRQDNLVLSQQVSSVRDLTRIGYIAVTELGMVASDETNTVVMYMPEVEKYLALPQQEAETAAAYSTGAPLQSGVRAGR